jgi:carbon storage regulator
MLVLARKLDQSIIINDKIRITIIDVRGNPYDGYNVKLGIEAPREMLVDRMEVYEDNGGHRIR